MDLDIWDMSPEEQKYTYKQSPQLKMLSGSIGHLRGYWDSGYTDLLTVWEDANPGLKSYEFIKEFDEVVKALRTDDRYDGVLHDRASMSKYCAKHPQCVMEDDRSYGVRVDSKVYSYLCRLNPNKGEYNCYIYAYKKEYLDKHMAEAARGIRFIDSHYKDKFRIPDGGTVRINFPEYSMECKCRYIDEYHLEVGPNTFHICEYAELLENRKATVEPVTPPLEQNKKKERAYASVGR